MDPSNRIDDTVVVNQGQKSPKNGSFNPKSAVGITCIVVSVLAAIAAVVLSLSFGMVLIPIIVGAVSAALALTGIALTVVGKNEDPATLLAHLNKAAKRCYDSFIQKSQLELISLEEKEPTEEDGTSSPIDVDNSIFFEGRSSLSLSTITSELNTPIQNPNTIVVCGTQTLYFSDIFDPFYTIVPSGKKGILAPKTDKQGVLIEKALQNKGKEVQFVCSKHGTSVFMVHLSAVDLSQSNLTEDLKKSLAFEAALLSYRALFSKALDLAQKNPDKTIQVKAYMFGHGCLNDPVSIKNGYLKAAKECKSIFLNQKNITVTFFTQVQN